MGCLEGRRQGGRTDGAWPQEQELWWAQAPYLQRKVCQPRCTAVECYRPDTERMKGNLIPQASSFLTHKMRLERR